MRVTTGSPGVLAPPALTSRVSSSLAAAACVAREYFSPLWLTVNELTSSSQIRVRWWSQAGQPGGEPGYERALRRGEPQVVLDLVFPAQHVCVGVDGPDAGVVEVVAAVDLAQEPLVDREVLEVLAFAAAEVAGDNRAGRAQVADGDPHLRGERRAAVGVRGVFRAAGGVEGGPVCQDVRRAFAVARMELRLSPRRDDLHLVAVAGEEGFHRGHVDAQGRDHHVAAARVVLVGLERDFRLDVVRGEPPASQ